ncbi:MAG: histidine phosphatase family protein [Gammaproteobacteria bacterium]
MLPDGATFIDLLRHGEAEGGARYRGSTDDPFTAEGWAQMWAAVREETGWDRVITSPLGRCADFARELARCRSIPLEVNEDLREMHFGTWEGRTAAALMERHPEALSRFWRDPLNHLPPGAEPLAQLRERTLRMWNSVIARYPHQHPLIITHGGPIRVLLGHLSGRALDPWWAIEVKHGSLYRTCIRTLGDGTLQAQVRDPITP